MKSMLASDIPSLSELETVFRKCFIATQPSELVKGRQMMKNRIYDVDAELLTRAAFDVLCSVSSLNEKSFDSFINLLDSVVHELLRYLPAQLAVGRFDEHENFRIDAEPGL